MQSTETNSSVERNPAPTHRTPCELWCDPSARSDEPRFYALPIDEDLPAYILTADTEGQAQAECERLGIELVA